MTVHKERIVRTQSLITMQLMKRERGSNFAVAVDQKFEEKNFKFDQKIDASVSTDN